MSLFPLFSLSSVEVYCTATCWQRVALHYVSLSWCVQSSCWLKFSGLKAGKQLLMTTYIHCYRQIIRDDVFLSEEKWFRRTCTRVKAFPNYTPKPVSCELGGWHLPGVLGKGQRFRLNIKHQEYKEHTETLLSLKEEIKRKNIEIGTNTHVFTISKHREQIHTLENTENMTQTWRLFWRIGHVSCMTVF